MPSAHPMLMAFSILHTINLKIGYKRPTKDEMEAKKA